MSSFIHHFPSLSFSCLFSLPISLLVVVVVVVLTVFWVLLFYYLWLYLFLISLFSLLGPLGLTCSCRPDVFPGFWWSRCVLGFLWRWVVFMFLGYGSFCCGCVLAHFCCFVVHLSKHFVKPRFSDHNNKLLPLLLSWGCIRVSFGAVIRRESSPSTMSRRQPVVCMMLTSSDVCLCFSELHHWSFI